MKIKKMPECPICMLIWILGVNKTNEYLNVWQLLMIAIMYWT